MPSSSTCAFSSATRFSNFRFPSLNTTRQNALQRKRTHHPAPHSPPRVRGPLLRALSAPNVAPGFSPALSSTLQDVPHFQTVDSPNYCEYLPSVVKSPLRRDNKCTP